jgi:hypothetical protein
VAPYGGATRRDCAFRVTARRADAGAVRAAGVAAGNERGGQGVLAEMSVVSGGFEYRTRHLGIVRSGPGSVQQLPRQYVPMISGKQDPATEGVTDGQSAQTGCRLGDSHPPYPRSTPPEATTWR